ncbi:ABC transporter permease [Nocardia jinanensis]|uniref:Taurine ABC transporter permease n=1 Tax=Nocardia jinanensis TaxID=382504 RepID=A0A917VW25_9NOCA|nr:ABC transporter permease subunit [Nocardia jinanensis]GGL31224.1 taurine ABC transporter permease [Nocardia jinanensis]
MTTTYHAAAPLDATGTSGSVGRPRPPDRARRGRQLGSALGWRALGVVVFLAGWHLIALGVASRAILPGPLEVWIDFTSSFADDPGLRYLGVRSPGVAINLVWTVGLAVVAWAAGSVLGAAAGLLSSRIQWIRNACEPLFFVFGAVPALVLAPFFLVWFGQGHLNKMLLVGFYCFVSVGLVAQSAAAALPPSSEEYAATQGLNTRARFLYVLVPGTLPSVLSGLRIALATAIAVQATVELLGSQIGIGRLIALRAGQGDVSGVLGLSIALGVVAIVLDLVLRRGIRVLTRWQ